jgi:hypothetical protein
MSHLTKEQRDALAAADFALPEKRKLPIKNTPDDLRHTRMAWSQLSRMDGLAALERKEARDRILARAEELGIDTNGWLQAVTFELSAMSLDMPTEEHPNRMPFAGILTRVDEASDEPPGGSGGKRVFIPTEVARLALPTLLGMGVDTTPEFDGHDAQFKIGVITETTIEGNAVHIAGFLYASDFPEECARIKAEKNRLGFSYECKVAISDKNADPWVVDRIIFTGAAILYKDKAAYRTTSLAATAEKEDAMTPEELKKLNDSIAALAASVGAISEKVNKIEAGKGASLAGPIVDQAMPHVGACNAAADAMEAAGIGTHPTHGHAAVLRRVGASILHGATMGKLPHVFRDHSYLGGDGVEAVADKATQDKLDAAAKETKELKDSLAALTTQLADMKAAAQKATEGTKTPDRKTLSNGAQALLSKFNVKDGDQITAANVDEILKAAGVPSGHKTIEAKLKLRAEGLLAA